MNRNIERLLVAVDGSARASGVLGVATDLAEALRASMDLLRVISIPPEFPPAANNGEHGDPLPAVMEREAMHALRLLVANEPRAEGSRLLVRQGPQPWRAILEVADESSADLIILGSHGYGGLDRILGTTAGKVANMAQCNVLVVHQGKGRPASLRPAGPSSRRTRSARSSRE